jgi:hypothetical protein
VRGAILQFLNASISSNPAILYYSVISPCQTATRNGNQKRQNARRFFIRGSKPVGIKKGGAGKQGIS